MRLDFNTMLLRDNAVPVLTVVDDRVYKTIWRLNPSFMKEIFVEKRSPSLWVKKLPYSATTTSAYYVLWLIDDIVSGEQIMAGTSQLHKTI